MLFRVSVDVRGDCSELGDLPSKNAKYCTHQLDAQLSLCNLRRETSVSMLLFAVEVPKLSLILIAVVYSLRRHGPVTVLIGL